MLTDITRISIQPAGLAFVGTCLCSYRVRGVDGSCAKHLTVESYRPTIVMLLTVIGEVVLINIIIISFRSPTHSFIPGLKPSFSANPSIPPQPFLFFFRTDYMDSTDCLLLLLSISGFTFSVFTLFIRPIRAVD